MKRFLVVFLLAVALVPAAVFNPAPAFASQEIADEIARLEALLRTPCHDPEALMEELIFMGNGYFAQVRVLNELYAAYLDGASQFLADFTVSQGDGQQVHVGRFIRRFMELRQEAADAGILAEGPLPPGAGLPALASSPYHSMYFYSVDDEEKANSLRELRFRIEDDLVDLSDEWNRRRAQYEEDFSDAGIARRHEVLNEGIKSLGEDRSKYFERKRALERLAMSGRFEHCLGLMDPRGGLEYDVIRVGPPAGLANIALHVKGKGGTPDALPGMGFRLERIPPFPRLERVSIPNFPFALHFKFDRASYLKLQKELLEIRIKAEEDYTLALGRTWRDVCTLGLTALFPPEDYIAMLPDTGIGGFLKDNLAAGEQGLAQVSSFTFGVTHQFVKTNAAIGDLLIHAVKHPIDSTLKTGEFILTLPAFMMPMIAPDGQVVWGAEAAGRAFMQSLESSVVTAGNGLTELMLDVNHFVSEGQSRFGERPDETLAETVKRLEGQLDSTLKLRAASEITEKFLGEVANLVLGGKMTEGGLRALDKVQDVLGAQVKAMSAIDRLNAARAAGAKVGAIPDDLARNLQQMPANPGQVIDDLARQNANALVQKAQIELPPPPQMSGNPVPATTKVGIHDVGEKIGDGAFSTAYVKATNDAQVVRFTDYAKHKGSTMAKLDDFGRRAVDELNSPAIRVAQRESVQDVVSKKFDFNTGLEVDTVIGRTEIVEKLPEMARETIARQGGRITPGQAVVYEQAIRDLNAKGYAWLDNHHSNFAFEALPGSDRWRVVVVDPGGIAKMQGATPAELAANARAAQANIMEVTADGYKPLGFEPPAGMRDNLIHEMFVESHNFDLGAMGLDNVIDVPFAPQAGKRFSTGNLANLSDDALRAQFVDHTRASLANDSAFVELGEQISNRATEINRLGLEAKKIADALENTLVQAGKTAVDAAGAGGPSALELGALLELSSLAARSMEDADCARARAIHMSGRVDDQIAAILADCERREKAALEAEAN